MRLEWIEKSGIDDRALSYLYFWLGVCHPHLFYRFVVKYTNMLHKRFNVLIGSVQDAAKALSRVPPAFKIDDMAHWMHAIGRLDGWLDAKAGEFIDKGDYINARIAIVGIYLCDSLEERIMRQLRIWGY